MDLGGERQANTVSPFEHLAQQMQDVLGDGGVLKEVIHPGEGPTVPQNASVILHFSGFIGCSDPPFDTTTNLRYPRMMKLGRDITLGGLELGILTMKKGEFSRFLLKPCYAFGDMGCPPHIPASATVLYEVQLINFLDTGQVDDFISLSEEEQNTIPLSTLIEVVTTIRSLGNQCFIKSRYDRAKDHYKKALMLLEKRETQSDVEKEKISTSLLPLYLNLSLTELRLKSPKKALKYANKALDIDSINTKALYRCGQAYLELGEYESARGCLITAQEKKPFDSDINSLLKKVTICYRDCLDKEKKMCSKMFWKLKKAAEV